MEQLKPSNIWPITAAPGSVTSRPPPKVDRRIIEAGSHVCGVFKDIEGQLLCVHFLYNNIQTHCTFKRFGDLGICDYTPEGYTNVVNFNAKVREKKRK